MSYPDTFLFDIAALETIDFARLTPLEASKLLMASEKYGFFNLDL
jgi:hypothetical protein